MRNPLSRNNTSTISYTENNPEKRRIIIIVVLLVVLTIAIPVFVTLRNKPDKYTKSATDAVRKEIPNAKVTDVKVAGGFAIATVSDPTAKSQINSGNVTVFKVNEDGSMTLLANGSSFTTFDLLALGIPLATQAELTGASLDQIAQKLASDCGYNGGDTPGYVGFDGSFDPDKWQIDSGTLDSVEQALTTSISNKNAGLNAEDKTVCVNATNNKSNATTDMKTYISTFTLELQFFTTKGVVTNHAFAFSIGPNYYQDYSLDGQKIKLDL